MSQKINLYSRRVSIGWNIFLGGGYQALLIKREGSRVARVHTTKDSVVSPMNSLLFFKALQRNGLPIELHLYGKGEHGFLTAPPFDKWFGRCLYWLKMEDWAK